MNRPLLLPGLPRIWRGPREIQFGADPTRAVAVRLPDSRTAQILDLLDGTRSERAVLLRGAELGVPTDHARALLDALHAAALVVPTPELLPTGLPHESRRRLVGEAVALSLAGKRPADTLRRRAGCRVLLTGYGRLAAPIAVALAEAGVGHIEAGIPGTVGPAELPSGPLRGADLGRPRREAISDAVSRAAPGAHTFPVRDSALRPAEPPPTHRPPPADPATPVSRAARPAADPPFTPRKDAVPAADPAYVATTLVVVLNHGEPPDVPPGTPHLAVAIREAVPVIGPFVPAYGSPCLRCLDLHRQDHDAAWPGRPRRGFPDAVEPCAVATLLAATAFATAEALIHLDGGRPQTIGAAVEITAPGHTRRRSWPSHPACRCSVGGATSRAP